MKQIFQTMWREHRVLLVAFIVSALVTFLLVLRLTVQVVYFSQNRDAELVGWMPLGYISHSYNIDTDILSQAVGLPADAPMHTSLEKIAEMQGRPLADVEQDILDAVEAERAGQ